MTCMKCNSRRVVILAKDDKKKQARHWWCSDCGAHYYRGQWWTKDEWARWVNNE